MSHLEKRAVTSSFLFRFPNHDLSKKPQVALFHRSKNVRTYQHKYAPISGSIENTDISPLMCASREIHEETTLTERSIRLFRKGKPFTFQDESIGREWTVHPFAFLFVAPQDGGLGEAGIVIDWEHDGYKWFDIEQVISQGESFPGVPRLAQSLRNVWFEYDLGGDAGAALSDGLRSLRTDYESGARQLASKALDMYASVISKLGVSDQSEAWWRNVRLVGWHLWKNGREAMGASILNLVLLVLEAIEQKLPSILSASSLSDCASSAIDQVRKSTAPTGIMTETLISLLWELHDDFRCELVRILTLSASSTITSSLTHVLSRAHARQGPPLHVRVLESRPLLEGVKTARTLASVLPETEQTPTTTTTSSLTTSKVTLFTDASVAVAARQLHVVLLGADTIDKHGNVSNKTGSLPAAVVAKHISPQAKVVVLSDVNKILPLDHQPEDAENFEERLSTWDQPGRSDAETAGHPDVMTVENVPFEWVDAGLIDYYVTDRGLQTCAEISQRAEEMRQKADGFFSDI